MIQMFPFISNWGQDGKCSWMRNSCAQRKLRHKTVKQKNSKMIMLFLCLLHTSHPYRELFWSIRIEEDIQVQELSLCSAWQDVHSASWLLSPEESKDYIYSQHKWKHWNWFSFSLLKIFMLDKVGETNAVLVTPCEANGIKQPKFLKPLVTHCHRE